MFLELEGVKGESVDKTTRTRSICSPGAGACRTPARSTTAAAGGAGKASFADISVTKYVDAASPSIMLFCANGKHFGKGKIIVRKAGENPLEYLTVSFEKVLVTAYQTGGSGGAERLTENVTLNFAKVKVEYVTQSEKGGKGTPHAFGWDISANTKV
ncbi:MAG: type VI secretion system tube protein Hcp [Gammaproteobacteria bacterium]